MKQNLLLNLNLTARAIKGLQELAHERGFDTLEEYVSWLMLVDLNANYEIYSDLKSLGDEYSTYVDHFVEDQDTSKATSKENKKPINTELIKFKKETDE